MALGLYIVRTKSFIYGAFIVSLLLTIKTFKNYYDSTHSVVHHRVPFPALDEFDSSRESLYADRLDAREAAAEGFEDHGWVGVTDPFFIYCYSAYLDERNDRWARRGAKAAAAGGKHSAHFQVVIVILVENLQARFEDNLFPKNFSTTLMYGGDKTVVDKPFSIISTFESMHGRGKGCWTLHINVTELGEKPHTVTFAHVDSGREICRLPVREPFTPETPGELGACVAPVYFVNTCAECKPQNISQVLTPWLETQKLLGVESVTIYNHSMTPEISRVLQYYIDRDYVQVHKHGPVPGYPERLPNNIAINDCLYRNMYRYKKILVLDLDEYVTPARQGTPLPLLIRDLARQHRLPYSGTHYAFANTLFYTDAPQVNEKASPEFPMFRYVYHTPSEAFPGGCKTIIDPWNCKHMSMHLCHYISKRGKRINVDTSIAKVHHYKKCETSWWKPGNMTCPQLFATMTRDHNLLPYQDIVMERTREIHNDMRLYGY